MTKSISCELFDYIEIACMFQYQIRLTLYSGKTLEGVAKTTAYNADKQETLQVTTLASPNEIVEIITSEIKSMDVLTANARFSHIDFDQDT